ncbi:M48 family metalloprotease [Marinomonas sp. 5E14-1]|uniref:M48 family metalloprotease n=1 Tax=Marinomonas sp. 5E14-1 TaxID=3153922 RepID=UPI003262D1B4
MRLFSNLTTLFAYFIFVSSFSVSTPAFSVIPDLEANQDERSLSNPSYVLGQHWFRQLNGSRALIDFPPAYNYLKETLSHILPQTNLYNKQVELTLLNSSQSNAFVIPGSHMFIYSDIMETISNEDMLYGLLAHEVAHLDLRHYERQSEKTSQELYKTLALIGAGIAVALAGADADTTNALWLGGIANQAENRLSYSRNQEQEADRKGQEYIINAGLPADSMSKLFQAFFKKALGRPKLEFLSTHPSPDTRLSDSFHADTKETILNYRKPTDFEYFRASLLSYRAGLEEQPYAYLDQHIQNDDARLFAKALFSYLTHSPERSLSFLSKSTQDNAFTDYLKTLSFISIDKKTDAQIVVQKQLEIAPNDIIFSMLDAQLNHTKPPQLPLEYLYEKRLFWRGNIQYFQSVNNLSMALHFQAQLNFHQGDSKTALFILERAQRDANTSDKETIRNTKASFEKIIQTEKLEDIDHED